MNASMKPALASLTLPRLATALVFLGVFAMAMRVSMDTDTWWHLRAGAWMVEHRQVLTRDAFSSTRLGEAWINHSWLSQIPMYWLWQTFGYAGLNLATAILVTLAFAFVYLQCEGNAYLKAFTLVLAAAASAVFWSARPQMVSFLLASIFAYVLGDYRWRGRNRLWVLPLLMVLWVNFHGGFAIGFMLLLITLGGQILSNLVGLSRPGVVTWRGAALLGLVTLACFAVIPLNPYGFTLYLYPLRTVSIGVLQDFIQEWQSPNFHLREAQIFIWLLLATLAAVGLGRRRMDLTDLALMSAFTYLALLAGRNVSIVALVAPPIITRHAATILADLHLRRPRLAALLDPAPAARQYPLLNWGLLAIVFLAVLVKSADTASAATNEKYLAKLLPLKAVAFVTAARPAGPMFNSYNWGGYLAWKLYPDYPVFVDGRTDLYDNELLSEYLRTARGQVGYQAVLDRYGLNLVVIEPASLLAGQLRIDPGWTLAYSDEAAVVFERSAIATSRVP